MLAELLAVKGVFVAIWFTLFFLGERIIPAASAPASKARLFNNGGLWVLMVFFSAGVVAPLTAWGVNHALWARPEWMTSGQYSFGFLLLDLIVLDCWIYWLHRAYHKVPVMWRMHEVHHRDEFLDTTSAVRFHVTELALSSALRLALIALLAIPLMHVVLFEIIVLCASVFHHSNLRLPPSVERRLSRVIVTPSIHWVHHHAVQADTNSNYATVLSFWDKLFGSKSGTQRKMDMRIGVQGLEDMRFFRLLLHPFTRMSR